jgi:hypothetical protein
MKKLLIQRIIFNPFIFRTLTLLFLSLGSFSSVLAQNEIGCGTVNQDGALYKNSNCGSDYGSYGSPDNRMRFTPVKRVGVVFHILRNDEGTNNQLPNGWNCENRMPNGTPIPGYTELNYVRDYIFNHPTRYEVDPNSDSPLCDRFASVNYIFHYNGNNAITGESPAETKSCIHISPTLYSPTNPCNLTSCGNDSYLLGNTNPVDMHPLDTRIVFDVKAVLIHRSSFYSDNMKKGEVSIINGQEINLNEELFNRHVMGFSSSDTPEDIFLRNSGSFSSLLTDTDLRENCIHVFSVDNAHFGDYGGVADNLHRWAYVSHIKDMHPYKLTTITAHELGHVLSLDHTFEGNDCQSPKTPQGTTDRVMDYSTRSSRDNNFNCSTFSVGGSIDRGRMTEFNECEVAKMHYFLVSDGEENEDFSEKGVRFLKQDYCEYHPEETIFVGARYDNLPHAGEEVTWYEEKLLKGDLYIYSGATLTIKCTVNFPEKAKIIVEQGAKLIIDGGTVTNHKRCGNLWAGIRVLGDPTVPNNDPQYHGTVELKNGATVSYAKTGIANYDTDEWGSPIPGTYGGIIKAEGHYEGPFQNRISINFINNACAVFLEDYPNNVPNQLSFKTCMFTVNQYNRDNKPSRYYGSNAYWDWIGAMFGIKRVNDVILTDNEFVNVAYPLDNTVDNQSVTLKVLRIGLHLQDTRQTDIYSINNNVFKKLWFGIEVYGKLQDLHIEDNTFIRNHVAINMHRCRNDYPTNNLLAKIKVSNNRFRQTNDYGFHALKNDNVDIYLRENEFNNAWLDINTPTARPYAVKLVETNSSKFEAWKNLIVRRPADTDTYLEENEIELRPLHYGIWVSNTPGSPFLQFKVHENDIYTSKVGIRVAGGNSTKVTDYRNKAIFSNTIFCDEETEAGIELVNVKEMNVVENEISPKAGLGENTNLIRGGIHLTETELANIRCNKIYTGPIGIQIEGNCMASALRNNIIDFDNTGQGQTKIGIEYIKNGLTGAQGIFVSGNTYIIPHDNLWRGCTHDTRTVNSQGYDSPFYVRDFTVNGLHALPINNTPASFPNCDVMNNELCGIQAKITTYVSPHTCPVVDNNPQQPPGGGDPGNIIIPGGFLDWDDATTWRAYQTDLYTQIIQDSITFPLFDASAKYTAKQSVLYRLHAEPAFLSGSSVGNPLASFWVNSQNTVCNQLILVDTLIEARKYTEASVLNESIAPTNQIETNQKKFNTVWLATIPDAEVKSFSTTQYNDLLGIANQCFISGGKSVWSARNLLYSSLNTIDAKTINFANNCTTELRKEKPFTADFLDTKDVFQVYPNPSQGNVWVSFSDETTDHSFIRVLNLTGQILNDYPITSKQKQVEVDIRNLPSGIYLLQVFKNNACLGTQKMTLVR